MSSHQAGGRARPCDFNRVTGRLLSLTTKLSLQPSSPNRTGTWTRVWVCVGAVEFAGLRAGGDGARAVRAGARAEL